MEKPLIYYIDDDSDDLESFGTAVEPIAIVSLFERGPEMMSALMNNREKPSVVFIDLNMPMKSGFEIIHEIKEIEELQDIAIVVLSTASDNVSVTRSRDLGANYFIQKPTTMKKLRKAIAHSLEIDWKKFNPTYGEFIHKHS